LFFGILPRKANARVLFQARVLHCAVAKLSQYQTELRQLNERLAALQKENANLQKLNASMWDQVTVEKSKSATGASNPFSATPAMGYPMFMASTPNFAPMFNVRQRNRDVCLANDVCIIIDVFLCLLMQMPVTMQHYPVSLPFQSIPAAPALSLATPPPAAVLAQAPLVPSGPTPGEKHLMQAMTQPVPIHTSSM
jgi:hypothetical protein